MMRNFFEMFLRARQALEFSHSQDPKADIGPIKIPQCSGPYPTVRLGLRLSNYLRPLTHELARRLPFRPLPHSHSATFAARAQQDLPRPVCWGECL